MKKYAVLIGNSQFPDESDKSKLPDLSCSEKDVEGLANVLSAPDRGEFSTVLCLKNEPSHQILRELQRTVNLARQDDLLLLYYSGHGKPNKSGVLYLATLETVVAELETSAIAINRVYDIIGTGKCKKVIIVLDCCYSGAAGYGFKGDVDVQLQQLNNSRGTYLVTASTELQVAHESAADGYSLFTKHLIAGLETGDADKDDDGLVSMNELYDYVHSNVMAENPAQQPTKHVREERGGFFIAKSGRNSRQERAEKIRLLLLEFEKQDAGVAEIKTEAMFIAKLPFFQLSTTQHQKDELLSELLIQKITFLSFIRAWDKVHDIKTSNLSISIIKRKFKIIESIAIRCSLLPTKILHSLRNLYLSPINTISYDVETSRLKPLSWFQLVRLRSKIIIGISVIILLSAVYLFSQKTRIDIKQFFAYPITADDQLGRGLQSLTDKEIKFYAKGNYSEPLPVATVAPAIDKSDAVAVVNGQYIAKSTLAALEKEIAERSKGKTFPKEKLIEELVQRELLVQDAMHQQLDKSPELLEQLEAAKKALLTQADLQSLTKANPVTETEIKAEYDRKIVSEKETEFKASHILVKTEAEAKRLIAELDNGADFAKLANKYSLDAKESQNGGDLGWFSVEQMVAPFSEAVAALENGKYSKDPVKTQFGFHVILKEDSRPLTPPPLESVTEQLRPFLQRKKVQETIETLRKQATIILTTDKPDVIAVVNGQNIVKSQLTVLEKEIAERSHGQTFPKEKLIEELIQRELLVQDATQKQLDKSPKFITQLDAAKKALLTQADLQNFIKANPVTEAEIKAEYDRKVAAERGTEYKARHILTKTEAEAKRLIAELDNGADFAKLANKYSLDAKESQNGGDLGWFSAEQMVAPFSEAVAALENGKYSKDPVKTQFGFHIILKEDSRSLTTPTLEEVKEQLTPFLQRKKVQDMIETLRNQAKVEILVSLTDE